MYSFTRGIHNQKISKWVLEGIISIILFITLLGCETPTQTSSPTPKDGANVVSVQMKGKIIVNNAVLRAGPDIEYEQIGTLGEGEIVDVVGETVQDDWLKIEVNGLDEYEEIWVSSDFVSMVTEEASSSDNSNGLLDVDEPTLTITAVAEMSGYRTRTPTFTMTAIPVSPTMKPPDTPTNTATSVPAATAPNTKTPTPHQSNPTDDLFTYWNSVSNENYADAWKLLTAWFQNEYHNNDINDYIEGYQSMDLCSVVVDVDEVEILSLSNSEAILRGQLTYYKGSNCTPYEYTFDHYMVFSQSIARWQINIVRVP